MSSKHTPRPWYCLDALVEDYIVIAESGGSFRMLKTLKILRTIIVNLGIIAVTVFALLRGADPTWIGLVGLLTLAAYNGVEAADYAALAQAFAEVRSAQTGTSDNDDSDS